jgi:hypothetical protein
VQRRPRRLREVECPDEALAVARSAHRRLDVIVPLASSSGGAIGRRMRTRRPVFLLNFQACVVVAASGKPVK